MPGVIVVTVVIIIASVVVPVFAARMIKEGFRRECDPPRDIDKAWAYLEQRNGDPVPRPLDEED